MDAFLRSPFAGIAPWALLSILASGPGQFETAVIAALSLALLVVGVGRTRGIKIHTLDVFGVAVFGTLAVVGWFATDATMAWLEVWAGELTNISLAAFAWVSMLVGKPFTLAYARTSTPPEHWDSPLFTQINGVVTTTWASAFGFAAVVGFVGDLFFADTGNFWTGWVLQLAAIFAAISFSEFYPEYATAKSDDTRLPSLLRVVAWLPAFVTVTGIAGLVTGSTSMVTGVGLIVAGAVSGGILAKVSPAIT